ncbi:MAG TPA: Clp1/GlmU family protein, partial [Verrucomicrobiae bacterium]|nr:Clp1/GlmU family protein [Verrucomicrobiae bacterium]
GDIGRGVKASELRALRPDLAVVLQREEECEPLVELLDGVEVLRLHPSPLVERRSTERRTSYRAARIAEWFREQRREHLLERGRVEEVLFGRSAPHAELEAALRPGGVVGLNRGAETLALGLITEVDARSITLRSDIPSLKGVNRLAAGEIFLEE